MRIDPNLFLQGRCEEALVFYRDAIGAKIETPVRFSDIPGTSAADSNKVMHAVFRVGETVVLASDGQADKPASFDGFSLALSATDDSEAERLFAALTIGGTVRMPLTQTSFAPRMGMATDRFGVPWMVVVPKQSFSR